jgi:hypothetical protein
MKRKIGLFLFALMLLSLSMPACRSRELCPAYTDSQPVAEETTHDTV